MSDTPNGQNGNGDPHWWPTDDDTPAPLHIAPPTNVSTIPAPPAPPPPPPPPRPDPPLDVVPAGVPSSDVVPGRAPADRFRNARATATRHRRWVAAAGVVILLVVLVNRWSQGMAREVGEGVAAPLDAHNQQLSEMVARIATAQNAPSTVTVEQPLSWLPCPVGADASGMIGFDPNTQYATLDPQRASKVATQVKAMIATQPVTALRLGTPTKTDLVVTVGGTAGVPLVDCSGATPARPDGGEKATTQTTAAPR